MTAIARPTLRRLPLAAALTGLAALAVALLLGPDTTPVPSVLLGGVAAALLLAELVRRGRELLRSGLGHQLALALLGIAVVAAAWSVLVAAEVAYLGFACALGLGGTALVMLSLLRLADEAGADQTPWQTLTNGPTAGATARTRFRLLGPLLAGCLAMLVALRIFANDLTDLTHGGPPAGAWVLALMMLGCFIVGPVWAVRILHERQAAGRRRGPAARDQQAVAAHLHDSVLQTLSLIQRNTTDPPRMAHLARQQERSLRAWLAGRDETAGTSLTVAVRRVAHEVEDEQPGAVIEVLVVGDAPLDRTADAMVHAAREAMRNAVRHAGGSVRVLVEVEHAGTRRLSVRDTGPGFSLDAVASERRGVRDAIIGRMEHVGGTAEIESGPAGTVVTLKAPGPLEGDPS